MSEQITIGSSVKFVGFANPEDTPDNSELLTEGEVYEVDSINEPEDDSQMPSFNLKVANPDYKPKSRKKGEKEQFLVVDVFDDEIELAEDDAAEEEDGDTQASDTIEFDDVKKGDVITIDDGDDEGAVTGEVVKKLKTKIVVREGDEDVEFLKKDVVSIVAAEADEAEEQEEEQEEEKPAKKAPAKKAAAKKEPAKKETAAQKKKREAAEAKAKKEAEAAKKAKAEEKAKAKAEAEEAKELGGVIVLSEDEEDEEIVELVNEADDVCELASELAEESANCDYRLGGVLYHVLTSKAYKEVDERYDVARGGFELYVQEQLGLGYRKAMYLVEIYSKFNKFGISGDTVAQIGWTKAQAICGAMTEENAEELVELAGDNTVSDLKDTIKESFTNKPAGEKGEVVKRTTFKFRLLEEAGAATTEYLEGAVDQLGLSNLDEAFEHIVSEWAQEHLDVAKTRKTAKKTSAKAKPAAKKKAA